MKRTFTYRTEWSDRSENSPQTVGQLPDIVELPDGERVSLESDERFQNPSRAGYIQIHPDVRVRYTFWGDNGTSRMGRAGGKVEVLSPKDSQFWFKSRCYVCGGELGLVTEYKLTPQGRAPDKWHEDCAREYRRHVAA